MPACVHIVSCNLNIKKARKKQNHNIQIVWHMKPVNEMTKDPTGKAPPFQAPKKNVSPTQHQFKTLQNPDIQIVWYLETN